MAPTQAYDRLAHELRRYDTLAVAFSGGVDSTLLLAVARKVSAGKLLAVTAASPLQPAKEIRFAKTIARKIGVDHIIFDSDEMDSAEFTTNNRHRCYICKNLLFKEIFRIAADAGIQTVAHGANTDDNSDYRPGMAAAKAMGVVAPLSDAGLGKREIRAMSKRLHLETWDKPAMACLASRIPYGTPITREALETVEAAEAVLYDNGFSPCRVRHHGDLARIEISAEQIEILAKVPFKEIISKELKILGFQYVCVDLDGYVQGSLNRSIGKTPGSQ